jgi:hypothetical protein
MSFLSNKHAYEKLIHQFLLSETDGSTFSRNFSTLWKQDRDVEAVEGKTWIEPDDAALKSAKERGEVTDEEFKVRWIELWRQDESRRYHDMVDNIFTACSCFVPESDSRATYEYDEDQFRAYVKETLHSYQSQRDI